MYFENATKYGNIEFSLRTESQTYCSWFLTWGVMKTIWQINETVGCHVSDPPQSYFKIYVVNCFFGCNVITILNVQIKSRKLCYKQKVLLRSVPTRDKQLLFEIKSNKWVMVEWIRYIFFFVKKICGICFHVKMTFYEVII